MHCEYCQRTFASKSSLNYHQKTAKYCLKIQGKSESGKYQCAFCDKTFTRKYLLTNHMKICENKEVRDLNKLISEITKKKEELKKQVEFLKSELMEKENIIQDYQRYIERTEAPRTHTTTQ